MSCRCKKRKVEIASAALSLSVLGLQRIPVLRDEPLDTSQIGRCETVNLQNPVRIKATRENILKI